MGTKTAAVKMGAKDRRFLSDACADAKAWAKGFPSLAEAWEACQRPDWMMWALNKLEYDDSSKLRTFACWCVRETPLPDGRKVWDLLTDERSRNAVEVAERYARGEASDAELDAARDAARDARAAARDAARDAQANALREIVGNSFKKTPEQKEAAA